MVVRIRGRRLPDRAGGGFSHEPATKACESVTGTVRLGPRQTTAGFPYRNDGGVAERVGE